MLRRFATLLAALSLGALVLHARGGGGCLARGTLIDTPTGAVPVENLHVGDAVWGPVGGERTLATVQAVYAVEPENYIELTAGGTTLRVTPEHPVQTAPGVFVRADQLRAGLDVFTAQARLTLDSAGLVPATVPAYNLLVSPGGVFFANGLAVHNKGCFLPDTPVTMADGTRRAISAVQAGDAVLAFETDGAIVHARVRNVLTHEVTSYLVLRTKHVELRVTEEHPFYVGAGTFKTAEALHTGDTVYVCAGTALAPQHVLALERVAANVTVYNLQTDAPHTFLANGVAVHNKGGGGFHSGGYRSSGSGGGGQAPPFLVVLIIGAVIVIVLAGKYQENRQDQDEALDYCFSRQDIDAKAVKTAELLKFISKVDGTWAPDMLRTRAREVFVELQGCWMQRDYAPMEPLMMRDLYEQHCEQLRGLCQTHEINRIDSLSIEAVDIVQVNYTEKKDQRSFTALITARARDYYLDDRTQAFLRGDNAPQRFQELWTFQLVDGTWRLREVEQTKESDVLAEENLFEQFTDVGRDQVYGAAAGQSGPAGPALPTEVQAKAQKIDRLLNFLVQTDKLWNREAMLTIARRTFTNIQLAWQDGRPEMLAGLAADEAFLTEMRNSLEANQRNGLRVEHRNFCVRKVEIVLVNNRDERQSDEFTARITAHAQTIITRAGSELRHDEWVKPWTEFWTFGRRATGAGWALRAIQPTADGESIVAQENTDEGSSADMMQWYYSKTRAN